jgi:hypothetical protein
MSVTDVLIGPECGLDVYEQPDEQAWVNCAVARNRIGLYFFVPIMLIVVLLLLWFGDTTVRIIAVITCAALAVAMALNTYWTPLAARAEHQTTQKEILARTSGGASRAEAIRDIQKEHLAREQTAATSRAANTTAGANLAGMMSIASALRK